MEYILKMFAIAKHCRSNNLILKVTEESGLEHVYFCYLDTNTWTAYVKDEITFKDRTDLKEILLNDESIIKFSWMVH